MIYRVPAKFAGALLLLKIKKHANYKVMPL